MFYFAYGLELNKKRMRELCPQSKPILSATLFHYRLVFSGWSRKWRGGLANVRTERNQRTPGGVYKVTESCQKTLDEEIGYPMEFDRIRVMVTTELGEAIEAFTYIRKRQSEETKPSANYLELILQGYKEWCLI